MASKSVSGSFYKFLVIDEGDLNEIVENTDSLDSAVQLADSYADSALDGDDDAVVVLAVYKLVKVIKTRRTVKNDVTVTNVP